MAEKRGISKCPQEYTPPSKQMKEEDDDDCLFSQTSSEGEADNSLKTDHSRNWTVEDLYKALLDKGLVEIARKFRDAQIDGYGLQLLNDDRLRTMGFKMGQILHINQFLQEVHCLETGVNLGNYKVFNDPIHGHIEVHPLCVKIIDTPQFQRLRFLKQLGMCYFVYPGASHNRFEHSIGVCHLAGQLVQCLHARQPELNITSQDILCVEIAGLCHDLGHGPFSHLFDHEFIPQMRPYRKWKHEDGSVLVFDHLVKENNLQEEFRKYGLSECDMDFIKEQIKGPLNDSWISENWPYKGRQKEKRYLYEIVANRWNGIDVDKWDYFARDGYMLGIKHDFDHTRFMKFTRVVEVEDKFQICVRDKEVGNLYDMFYLRSVLHRQAYQHKVTKSLEVMMVEALMKANDFLLFSGKDGEKKKMSECIDDVEAYTKLTDEIFQQILYSSDPNLKESQTILRNILTRKLYKCVGQSRPYLAFPVKDRDLRQEIFDAMLQEDSNAESPLKLEDLVIHFVYVDYGMEDKNPIDYVRFFDKNNINQAVQLRKNQVSQLLPDKFAEKSILVYCKDPNPEKLGIASRCFTRWCEINKMGKPKQSGWEMTPLKNKKVDSHNVHDPEMEPSETRRNARSRLFES